jgi:hypothetical protein
MLRRAAIAVLPLAALLAVAAARPPLRAEATPAALVGPPWISVEYPANPFAPGSRGAYLLVHAFHHGTATALPVSGTAEGIVRGQRRTVRLAFEPAGRPGVYALRRQWDDAGVWTLVVRATREASDAATALVEIAPSGEVARVQVPTARHREGDFPRAVTAAEVEAGLRARVGTVSVR